MRAGSLSLGPAGTAPGTPAKHHMRIDSNLVLISVTVTDHKNRLVTGLGREAFRVFDGKTEQKVTQFAEEDAPLSEGIVFDNPEIGRAHV